MPARTIAAPQAAAVEALSRERRTRHDRGASQAHRRLTAAQFGHPLGSTRTSMGLRRTRLTPVPGRPIDVPHLPGRGMAKVCRPAAGTAVARAIPALTGARLRFRPGA